jgi:hypothetical protein
VILVGVAILAVVSVSGAREAVSAPAMTDKAPDTAAQATVGANGPVAGTRESRGIRCDPLEPGLVDRPAETGLVAVMMTSCTREVRFLSGGGSQVLLMRSRRSALTFFAQMSQPSRSAPWT